MKTESNRMTLERKRSPLIKWGRLGINFEDFANNKKIGYVVVGGVGAVIIVTELAIKGFL